VYCTYEFGQNGPSPLTQDVINILTLDFRFKIRSVLSSLLLLVVVVVAAAAVVVLMVVVVVISVNTACCVGSTLFGFLYKSSGQIRARTFAYAYHYLSSIGRIHERS
jgi:hypothetical protein